MLQKLPTPQDIRDAAAEKGISMRKLFREAEVHYSSFSRWENNKTSVNLATLQALWKVLEEEE